MRISDWSSDVCSSDLIFKLARVEACRLRRGIDRHILQNSCPAYFRVLGCKTDEGYNAGPMIAQAFFHCIVSFVRRSEERTSELQSLMRISYAVFCLKKKNNSEHLHDRIQILFTIITSYTNSTRPRLQTRIHE